MKIAKNLLWVGLDRVGFTLLQFIMTIILARILSPEDFGLFSLTIVFTALSNMIVDSGMAGYLIQKENPSFKDYSTLFLFNLLISLVLYGLLFSFSPYLGRYYEEPSLPTILRLTGLSIIIRSMGIVQFCILHRKFLFKEEAFLNWISYGTSLLLAIVMAKKGYGVWALIAQQLAFNLLQTLTVWFYIRFFPKLIFSKQSFKEMFSFGINLFLSSMINVIYNDSLGLILAKKFDLTVAGIFYQAKKLSNIPTSIFTIIFDRASFPILSRIKDSSDFAQKASYVCRIVFFISFPILINVVLFSDKVILIILGEQWRESAPILQILSIGAIFLVIESSSRNVLKSIGKVGIIFKAEIGKKIVSFFLLFAGLFFGLKGFTVALVLGFFIGFLVNIFFVNKYTLYFLGSQLKDLSVPFLLGIVSMVIPVYLDTILKTSVWLSYISLTSLQFAIFIVLGYIFSIREFKTIRNKLISLYARN